MFGITPYRRSNDLFANPWRAMDAFERSFFGGDRASFRIDIEDEGDALLLSADLPGFEKEDIHIDLSSDRLTIRAEHHTETEQKEKNYLRCERICGSYSRSFGLDGIDADNISASYHNGVLKLTLPKLAAPQNAPRRIEIQ